MNDIPQIKDIDAALLRGLARQALRSPAAEISHWQHHPISYINTEKSNFGLHRFQGIAQDQDQARPWSVVLKAVHAPTNDTTPACWNYHRREILAYQHGLLADLPGGLVAPRCFGITEHRDGVCWLWLEDISEGARRSWSLAEYGLAARHLGRFNGAYITSHPLPVLPWLSQDWLRGWLSEYDASCRAVLELVSDERFWEHPLLRLAFPRPVTDEILRLWAYHNELLATLERLPRTFCHLDAYRPNLFIRHAAESPGETVAIDWVFAGIGAVGEEIANLLAASLIWFEYDAAQARCLDEAVFAGYLDGLREAGWQGDGRLVRLGYTAACALRWGVVGLWWMKSLGESAKQADLERQWKQSMPELVSQWAKTMCYVLSLAQEAYQLQRALF